MSNILYFKSIEHSHFSVHCCQFIIDEQVGELVLLKMMCEKYSSFCFDPIRCLRAKGVAFNNRMIMIIDQP
jgi:hypothetical protein